MSQISCLKRITIKDQQSCGKFNQIVLKKDSNQIFIGRDIDCNFRISSIEISRKHALVEYSTSGNYWSVSDLNSTNGLFINSIQLQPNSPYRLVDGDRVSFGPPNQSQFCYQFVDNYSQNPNTNCVSYELSAINLTTIPVIPIVTRIQTTSTNSSLVSSSLDFDIEPNQSRTISLTTTMPTRSGLTYSTSSTRCTRVSGSSNSLVAKKVTSRKTSVDNRETQSLNDFVEHDYSRSRSSDKNNRNKKSSSLRLRSDTEVKTKASKSSELERKLIAKEKEKLEKSKKSLEQQKTMDRLKIKRKEEELKKKQKELDRKEKEAKKREEEINSIRKELLKEKKLLTEKRQELTKEYEQTDRQSAKRKLRSSSNRESTDNKRQCSEDIKKKVIEEMFDSELTCSVCSEYFIQAVNLNCSHTFCLSCIEEWKHSKSGAHVCPICREKIENQNRELILDNLIDQFIGQMKPHLKEHRLKITEERKKRLEKKISQNQNNSARNGSTSSRGNGLSRLIPSLHFFLRSNPTDSDSETDDVNVFGLNFGDTFLSSSSSDSSDSSSESEAESDSSDDSNSSDEETLSDGDQSTGVSIASPQLSYNSDSDESIVSIRSNDSEVHINLSDLSDQNPFDSFGAEDSDDSSDDSDFSPD